MRDRRRLWWFLLFALFLGVLPAVLRSGYLLDIAIMVGINIIIVIGLNLLMGYAGQVSLGQSAFVCIGAYTTALLTVKLGWSPWVGMAAAMAAGAVIAGVVGIPLLQLRGHYLALGT